MTHRYPSPTFYKPICTTETIMVAPYSPSAIGRLYLWASNSELASLACWLRAYGFCFILVFYFIFFFPFFHSSSNYMPIPNFTHKATNDTIRVPNLAQFQSNKDFNNSYFIENISSRSKYVLIIPYKKKICQNSRIF